MPRMDEKKLHTREFQLKGSNRNMRCKFLQKRFTGKTTECSRHLRHIAIEKDILPEPSRCIFQVSLKYIKLVIPKIPPAPPFVLAGGEGLNFQPNFQKGEGRLDRTSNFRGGLLGKRKVTFFRGGEGEGCNFHTKNKLKSEIFKDKKSL